MQTDIFMAIVVSFLMSVILTPFVIPVLQRFGLSQIVREDGPKNHWKKNGTPTMGGLIILCVVVLTSLLYISKYQDMIPVLFPTLGFGLIGFIDDYIKILRKQNLGLRVWQKLCLQMIVTVLFLYYMYQQVRPETDLILPFLDEVLPLGSLYYPMLFFVILGTVNGANFTDGLDGLESGVTVIIAVFLTVVSVEAESGISIITAAVTGSLLGFLLFNVYPAKVFMGDTGSLSLGGFVASTAILLKIPAFLLLIAMIYFIEVVSVMIQVVYFKCTNGKRFFKMAPIHHHLEMCGLSETRITLLFAMITALMCLIALKNF